MTGNIYKIAANHNNKIIITFTKRSYFTNVAQYLASNLNYLF